MYLRSMHDNVPVTYHVDRLHEDIFVIYHVDRPRAAVDVANEP